MSVGLFLLRISVEKFQVWIIRIIIAGSVLFGIIYDFLIIFQCRPLSFWWDLNPDHTGTCLPHQTFAICGFVISALNSAADLVFAALPMFMVWKTSMNWRTRMLVCLLLGLASV